MNNVGQLVAQHLPAARRGDARAFADIVALTQNMVTSVALALVRDIQHSEDIAQEAYLTAWKRLKHLRNPDSFLPWLRQIARNQARDHLRRQRVRPGDQAQAEDASVVLEQAGQGESSSEEEVLRAEQDRLIAMAMESLPDESREVLTLYYREGQSSQQVATLLGLSDAAVRKRLSRARNQLREDVERRFGQAVALSVPGMAFTATMASLLTAASPPAAAAVTLLAAGKSGIKLVVGTSLGLLVALAGGLAGVILGLRPVMRSSIDYREHQALLKQRRIGVVIVILAVAGFAISTRIPGWWAPALIYVLFFSALAWQHKVVLPRILSERHARERRQNPDAARQQARQRLWGWIGLIGGGLSGLGGLLAGLLASGRIAF